MLLLNACEHNYSWQGAISRAPNERSQYCMSAAAKIKQEYDYESEQHGMDCHCRLTRTASKALPHVEEEMREKFLQPYVHNMTCGPFHLPNHKKRCQIDTDPHLFADKIEGNFALLKRNKSSLRPMCLVNWVSEVDFRLCAQNAELFDNLPINTIKFIEVTNPKQMSFLQNRIRIIAKRCMPDTAECDIMQWKKFATKIVSMWTSDELIEEREENLALRYIGIRLKLKYLNSHISKLSGVRGSSSVLPRLMPDQLWDHTCGPKGNTDFMLQKSESLLAQIKYVLKELRKMDINKVEGVLRLPRKYEEQPPWDDPQINELITFFLEQQMLDLRATIFSEEREEQIFNRKREEHKAKGETHMKAQYVLARERRQNLKELKQIYESFYLHFETSALRQSENVYFQYFLTVKEITVAAKSLDIDFHPDVTALSSLRIMLFQDCRKLISRYKLAESSWLWIRRWTANVCIRLLKHILRARNGEIGLSNQFKIEKYMKAASKFLHSTNVKNYDRELHRNFQMVFRKIIGDNPHIISEQEICDLFEIPEYPEYDYKASADWKPPRPSNPFKSSTSADECPDEPPSKKLKPPDFGKADDPVILYFKEEGNKDYFVQQRNVYLAIQQDSGVNEEVKASEDIQMTDPIIPDDFPQNVADFDALVENLLNSRPRKAKELEVEYNGTNDEALRSILSSQKNTIIMEWKNRVSMWAIQHTPLIANGILKSDEISHLMDFQMVGKELSILFSNAKYGTDLHLQGLEKLLRNHPWANPVSVITSRPFLGSLFALQEMGISRSIPPAICLFRQERSHITVGVFRNDTRIEYADTERPKGAPTQVELIQMHAFFAAHLASTDFNIYSHACLRQETPSCLFLAFLNGYLMLDGVEDLSLVKIDESQVRFWVYRCFKSGTILCPFEQGVAFDENHNYGLPDIPKSPGKSFVARLKYEQSVA